MRNIFTFHLPVHIIDNILKEGRGIALFERSENLSNLFGCKHIGPKMVYRLEKGLSSVFFVAPVSRKGNMESSKMGHHNISRPAKSINWAMFGNSAWIAPLRNAGFTFFRLCVGRSEESAEAISSAKMHNVAQ